MDGRTGLTMERILVKVAREGGYREREELGARRGLELPLKALWRKALPSLTQKLPPILPPAECRLKKVLAPSISL